MVHPATCRCLERVRLRGDRVPRLFPICNWRDTVKIWGHTYHLDFLVVTATVYTRGRRHPALLGRGTAVRRNFHEQAQIILMRTCNNNTHCTLTVTFGKKKRTSRWIMYKPMDNVIVPGLPGVERTKAYAHYLKTRPYLVHGVEVNRDEREWAVTVLCCMRHLPREMRESVLAMIPLDAMKFTF